MMDNELFQEYPEWVKEAALAVQNNWHNQGVSERRNWMLIQHEDGILHLHAAPCYQEVLGGERDGDIVWTPFIFDIGDFIAEVREQFIVLNTGVTSAFESAGQGCAVIMMELQRVEDETPFMLSIHLEPPPESATREIIDTIHNEIREKHDVQ